MVPKEDRELLGVLVKGVLLVLMVTRGLLEVLAWGAFLA